ncbi:MAG: DUF1957 domain-containing protein [Phycisphaerae bacterium]|nr:DUF1957 domain-containing protein [Phycisphaerae bacterium]
MAETLGSLCFVLHGHLPHVLHHGSWPHGEAWLYEAAAETYLPILDMIGEVALNRARPALTIGLTPVLLEQLGHERFKSGFAAYLAGRMERARDDRREFEKTNQLHFAYLAERWEQWYGAKLEHFERIGRSLPGEFAQRCREGHIQLLTSNATHAYMPLLLNDEMLRAQMACGVATSRRHLGLASRGMWLPECAYRPTWEHWLPAVLYDNARYRPGIEQYLAAVDITHFFVESHMILDSHVMGVREGGGFVAAGRDRYARDPGRPGVLEGVGVVSQPGPPSTFAFARHPRVSEQVWSGDLGYPGAGEYLEFHRKYGERGLRYHKVTSRKSPLSDKQPYYPDDVGGKVFEHAEHFCNVVREVLGTYRHQTGRQGVCVAPFDAELFGHWWFEGPRFLRDVILNFSRDRDVKLMTAEEALYHHPPEKVVRLPEGSWGEGGDHRTWINDRIRWMWEIEYRAEGEFLRVLHALPWRTEGPIREVLERAARQLLLLQASDWPFVVQRQQAVDYGIQRFAGHATAFGRAVQIAEDLGRGGQVTELQKAELADMDAHDDIFSEIDLNWWMP